MSFIIFAANMLIYATKINAAVVVELVAYWKFYACLFKSEIVKLFSDFLILIFHLKSDSRCFLYQCLIDKFIFNIVSLVQIVNFFYHVNFVKVKVKDLQRFKDVMQMKFLQIINVLS